MKIEFERYGLAKFRKLTGLLELLGGIGLITGYYLYPALLYLSALGLATLMLLGVIVRLRVKDSYIQILPALLLMIINILIIA
jgi:hypothetical protein